jgi:hypothetical protein
MTGIPDFNYPAFAKEAENIRSYGATPVSPAENHGGDTTLPRHEYFKAAIPQVVEAASLHLLEGWEKSNGATMETLVYFLTHDERANWSIPTASSDYFHWLSEFVLNPDVRDAGLPGILHRHYLTHGDAFDRELDEIRVLHAAKRADYTGDESALANYEFSSGMMGVPVAVGMFGRLSEKLFRIKSLLGTGREPRVTDEKMTDTLRDIAIIATLMRLHLSGAEEYQK